MSHTAIVAEGGGQRGIYTAGVLDAFHYFGFNPFTMGIGVSAGAQNLLSYFLDQPGYARRAIEELTRAPGFFVPYRWVGDRGIIDLDSYFARSVNDPDYLLPYQRITTVQKKRRLHFVATDMSTLEPVYLEPDGGNVVDCLKASSAIPFLYKPGVEIGGRTLLDGGISDPIPIKRAVQQGAKRLLLIRTSGQDNEPGWRIRLEQFRRIRVLPTQILRMLDCHETAEKEAERFIDGNQEGIELVIIKPENPLRSQVFGSSSDDLVTDYKIGWYDGAQTIASVEHWQS
ncbi:MAG: patatin-like phospholipase family protein [Granulosicoccus sp.]|nr:patatin-like phospholipase family protein [Granulosicoccus sp.]